MKITRCFSSTADRYAFDFDRCSLANGYAQIDTSQDAPYFGTWASPAALTIVSYVEGDIYTTECKDAAEFAREIRAIKDWNERAGHTFYGIDPGVQSSLRSQFESVGLSDLLH